jgi:hypothetical protein
MKARRALGTLVAPSLIAAFWWVHVQYLKRQFTEETKALRVLGYNFHVVDRDTQKPPAASVHVQRSLKAVSIPSGSHTRSGDSLLHITGRWAGTMPQRIQVQADGYHSQVLSIGEYPDQPVKLELKRVGFHN